MSDKKCALCGKVFIEGSALHSFDPIHFNAPYYCTKCVKSEKAHKHYEKYTKNLFKWMQNELDPPWYNDGE